MATCLALSSAAAAAAAGDSEQHDARGEAAAAAALAVALAVEEDSIGSLVGELLAALEDVGGRALGAAQLIAEYGHATKHDLEDHVDELLTVRGGFAGGGGGHRSQGGGSTVDGGVLNVC
jgi:hypothetical protein